jgi:hypothetical protein
LGFGALVDGHCVEFTSAIHLSFAPHSNRAIAETALGASVGSMGAPRLMVPVLPAMGQRGLTISFTTRTPKVNKTLHREKQGLRLMILMCG